MGDNNGPTQDILQNYLILNTILNQLPAQCVYKYREVSREWNKILAFRINQEGSPSLLKVVKKGLNDWSVESTDITEIIGTMQTGMLNDSICTRIYIDNSMENHPHLLQQFLELNGTNIQSLHYDGNSISEWTGILTACSKKLVNLTLWSFMDPMKSWYIRSRRNVSDHEAEDVHLPKLPQLKSLTIVSGQDGNQYNVSTNAFHLPPGFRVHPLGGLSNPPKKLLCEIFKSSSKLDSLSARLCDSSILEALNETNHYQKLRTLCLKSRVDILQLHALCCSGMKLKVLILSEFCVALSNTGRFSCLESCRYSDIKTQDPNYKPRGRNLEELDEFIPLVLEFLKTQANTLEFLKIGLYCHRELLVRGRNESMENLWNDFPTMPKLVTLILPFEYNEEIYEGRMLQFGKFPKLRNVGETCPVWDYKRLLLESPEDEVGLTMEMDATIINDKKLSFSDFTNEIYTAEVGSLTVENLREILPSLHCKRLFPNVTEFHYLNMAPNDFIPYGLPMCCPHLKHLYYQVNFLTKVGSAVNKYFERLTFFIAGVKPDYWEELRENQPESPDLLEPIVPSPPILDMKGLETFDIRISTRAFEERLDSLETLITHGVSKMHHLKKLHFELKQRKTGTNSCERPESLNELHRVFRERPYFWKHESSHYNTGTTELENTKCWIIEFDSDRHTSEWSDHNYFPEDPDIWESFGLTDSKN